MRALGRAFQQLALLILPIAVVLEISGVLGRSFNVADLLKALIFSVLLFIIGRMIEGYAAKSAT